MQPQIDVRVRDVPTLPPQRLHVPDLSVEGVPDLPDPPSELPQLALVVGGFFGGNSFEEDETVRSKLSESVVEGRVLGEEVVVMKKQALGFEEGFGGPGDDGW